MVCIKHEAQSLFPLFISLRLKNYVTFIILKIELKNFKMFTGNSDLDQPTSNYRRDHHQTPSVPGSPTSRLLLEYEMHLRNTLAKGMDAESYSLHTFEALLTQSMENLEFAESLPSSTQRSPYTSRRRKF